MLESWTSAERLPATVRLRYELFPGEALRRLFDGVWTEVTSELLGTASEDQAVGWGILYPTTGTIDVVSSFVSQAYCTGMGTWS